MSEAIPQPKKSEGNKIILPEVASKPRKKPERSFADLRGQIDKEIFDAKRATNEVSPLDALKALGKKQKEAGVAYDRELEEVQKSNNYSPWIEARRKYRALEEKLDLGLSESATENDYRERLAQLKKEMDGAKEGYEHEMEDTARSKGYSEWIVARNRYRDTEELLDLLSSHKDEGKKETEEKEPQAKAPTRQ